MSRIDSMYASLVPAGRALLLPGHQGGTRAIRGARGPSFGQLSPGARAILTGGPSQLAQQPATPQQDQAPVSPAGALFSTNEAFVPRASSFNRDPAYMPGLMPTPPAGLTDDETWQQRLDQAQARTDQLRGRKGTDKEWVEIMDPRMQRGSRTQPAQPMTGNRYPVLQPTNPAKFEAGREKRAAELASRRGAQGIRAGGVQRQTQAALNRAVQEGAPMTPSQMLAAFGQNAALVLAEQAKAEAEAGPRPTAMDQALTLLAPAVESGSVSLEELPGAARQLAEAIDPTLAPPAQPPPPQRPAVSAWGQSKTVGISPEVLRRFRIRAEQGDPVAQQIVAEHDAQLQQRSTRGMWQGVNKPLSQLELGIGGF